MREFGRTVLASLFSASAVSLAVIWLINTSADKYISLSADKQLENVKHALNEQLENYKAVIGTEEAANQVRFNSIVNHRAQQLSEFYWPIYIRLQTDNAIWKRVLGAKAPNSFPAEVGKPLEKFLLDNHREILKIIQTKFYLAEPSPEFEEDLLSYVRHVAVYMAMRTSPVYDDKEPIYFDEKWPAGLFPRFKARLEDLQNDYNSLLKQARRREEIKP